MPVQANLSHSQLSQNSRNSPRLIPRVFSFVPGLLLCNGRIGGRRTEEH